MRVGINGFGRIGRLAFRAILARHPELEVVAINDLVDTATNAHLLRHDSNYGNFPGTVAVDGDGLVVNGKHVAITAERDWSKLDWGGRGIDLVIEATGVGTNRPDADKHVQAGAKKVIISAPAKGEDITIVMGVNDKDYDAAKHNIISNASCTTNCLAPMAKVLLEEFGIAKDARGNARADTEGGGAYATSVAKVFAAGDMRRGQSLVVWAIREGRQCARSVDLWLMGETSLPR